MAVLQPLTKGGTNQTSTLSSTRVLPPLTSLKTSPTPQPKKAEKPKPTISQPTPVNKPGLLESAKSVFQGIQQAVAKIAKPKKDEGLGAPIGRLLQKVPDTTIKIPEKYKSEGLYDEIVEFTSGLPGSIAQSYGRSLELLSTPDGKKQLKEGAKNLPKTMAEVKAHIDNKEWGKAFEAAFSNPALSVALDVSDFIPIAGVVGFGVKKTLGGLRKTAQQVVKEGIEETEKKVIKTVDKSKSKIEKPTTPKGGAIDTGIDIDLVRDAIKSGDLQGAKALYDDLPKGSYKPSFETLKESVARGEERQTAQFANEGVKAVKENYGQYQGTVQKMKNFLRISAEKKNSEGTLFREHIPAKNFGVSSDEIATDLGMTENQFMEKIISELDIQKQPVPRAAKDVSVARSQLPVGEGIEKASRLEARVTQSLGKTPQEIKDQLGSTFTQMNKKENIQQAVKYINEKPEEAMAVLRGEKEAPQGLLKNSIYVAMENEAKGNVELARKLASLQSTRAGQELSILTEIDPNSPVKIMRDIIVIREEAFIKKYGGKKPKEITDKIVGEIKKKVKVADKYDWNNFIKNLPTC